MPGQNSYSKVSAHIQLLYLLQMPFIAYCVKKGNLHFGHVLEDGLLGKIFGYIPP